MCVQDKFVHAVVGYAQKWAFSFSFPVFWEPYICIPFLWETYLSFFYTIFCNNHGYFDISRILYYCSEVYVYFIMSIITYFNIVYRFLFVFFFRVSEFI